MERRILIMSTEFPPGPGGISTYTYQTAAGLTNRGWQVVVLSTQDDATDEEIRAFNAAQPFRVVRLHRKRFALIEGLYRLGLLFHWWLRLRPQAGLALGERAVWLMGVLHTLTRLPWLAIGIANEFTVQERWVRALTRWSFNTARLSVAISDFTRRQMITIGIHPDPIRVIPCGADDSIYHVLEPQLPGEFRARLGLEGKPLILTVGRVTARKGQEVVIRAMPHVLAAGLDAHYVMIGVPVEGDRMQALARELDVTGHVHLFGRADDQTVAAAYNACDVFVMTSRHTEDGDFEGFGIAAVEAALCGKPSVVSAGSGLAEAVVDGETAIVVPLEDPQATAQAIIRLLRDPALARRLADQGLQRAQAEQTWERRLDEMDQALQEMLRD